MFYRVQHAPGLIYRVDLYNGVIVMPPPLIGGGIKRCFCLTSGVCLSRTSSLSREQRGLGRPKLAFR